MSAYSHKRTFRTSLHRHQLIKDGCQVDEAASDCDVGDVSDSERALGHDPEIAIMSSTSLRLHGQAIRFPLDQRVTK